MKILIITILFIAIIIAAAFSYTIKQLKLMVSRSDKKLLPDKFQIRHNDKNPLKQSVADGMKLMENLPHEDIYTYSYDNLKLHGYFYPSEKPCNKFIIGIHGFKSGPKKEFSPFIEFYHSHGFNIILPDNRGHRQSQGEYLGMGILDRLDCINWAEYTVKNYGEDSEILLHGISMGGAAVLSASGERTLPAQVKGIISDCSYSSMYEQVKSYIRNYLKLPVYPFINMGNLCCRYLTGYDLKTITPLKQIAHSEVPVLIIHGEKDSLVPVSMAEDLYNACTSEIKKILIIPGADHEESIALSKEQYENAIEELFM